MPSNETLQKLYSMSLTYFLRSTKGNGSISDIVTSSALNDFYTFSYLLSNDAMAKDVSHHFDVLFQHRKCGMLISWKVRASVNFAGIDIGKDIYH